MIDVISSDGKRVSAIFSHMAFIYVKSSETNVDSSLLPLMRKNQADIGVCIGVAD